MPRWQDNTEMILRKTESKVWKRELLAQKLNQGQASVSMVMNLRLHCFRDSLSLCYRRFLSNLQCNYVTVLNYMKFHTLIFRRGVIDALLIINTCDEICAVLGYCAEQTGKPCRPICKGKEILAFADGTDRLF